MPEPKPTPTPTKPPLMRLKEFLQTFHDTDQYATDRSFCFIIGSGASLASGIPTGGSLVNRWLVEMHDMDDGCTKRILPPHSEIKDYADALLEGEKERLKTWSEKRFADWGNFSFENRASFYGQIYKARFTSDPSLGEEFLRALIHRRKPSIGYHLMARILNRTRHNVVITTNFDHLVEDSIAITENEAIQSFGHAELAAFVRRRPQHPVVAKIHGDILLKTYNATDEIKKLNDHWRNTLRELFQTYTPIIIGYGGNDPGFMNFLIAEFQTWTPPRHCYWFVRKAESFDKIPFATQLNTVKALRLVECPGFTELMLKLNEIFNYQALDEELRQRADRLATELNEAEKKARGDLEDHERRIRESVTVVAATAVEIKAVVVESVSQPAKSEIAPTPPKKTWQQWRDAVWNARDTARRKTILAEAMKEFPDHLGIQAADVVRNFEESPSDQKMHTQIQKWLKECETKFGPESEETLTLLHYLAVQLRFMFEPEKADAICRRVIAARVRLLGEEHPDTLASRNNLANALVEQGKYTEAETEHRAVLEISQRVLGAEHPNTLMSRNNLAAVLQEQGKHAEAEAEHRAMLEISQRVLGPEHPDTLGSRNNLAAALRAQGKFAEAEAEHRAVLEIRQRVLGPESPKVFQSCFNLAVCLRDQNKKPEALEVARRGLDGCQKLLSKDHPDLFKAQKLVAGLEGSA
jgi:tetratricopeptide (TPR) repeat protein/NAD-dependent SIR2 family protein deacetylase